MITKKHHMKKQPPKKENEMVFDLNDFRFIGNHVLIQAIKAASKSGWAKPKQKDDKPEFGRVLSIGEKCESDIKVGDIVMFGRYVTESTDNNGETYYMAREDDLKAVKKR